MMRTFYSAVSRIVTACLFLCLGLPLVAICTLAAAVVMAAGTIFCGGLVGMVFLALGLGMAHWGDLGAKLTGDSATRSNVRPFPKGVA